MSFQVKVQVQEIMYVFYKAFVQLLQVAMKKKKIQRAEKMIVYN